MFYRTEVFEFLETLKSEWGNTREEFPRTPEEIARGEELERRCEEWQRKYAEQQPEPDWDGIFDYEAEQT
jgi:hypothetical protein